jgi:hypothetical protein
VGRRERIERITVADYIGWTATAVFLGSYFCARAESLKRVQIAAAAIWVAYGLLIRAVPVVASNALLIGVAAWTIARPRRLRAIAQRD